MARANRIQQAAEAIAAENDSQFNMVSVVVKSGKVISVGMNNMLKTSPVFFNGTYDKGIHAEYAALRPLKFQDLTNAKMYVFYFRKNGTLGNSHPCSHCMRYIKKCGIGTVFYIDKGEMKTL